MSLSQHVNSWYAASANWPTNEPALVGDVSADVCVIGAGITGLSAALNLAETGFAVTVLESQCVGWGASGRSGGQMIFGYGCEQDKMESLLGREDSKMIWDAGVYGMELLKDRVAKHNINCDLKLGHAHVALKQRQARELESWCDSLRKDYGYDSLELWNTEKIRSEIASNKYISALYDSNSGHIHPLNYTLGLSKAAQEAGVTIYENSSVINVTQGDEAVVKTNKGSVKAKFLLLAGNAYLNKVMPKIESRVMPVGTYIGATTVLGEEKCRALIKNDIAVADINFVLDYFRCSSDHRLLFGGRVSYSTVQPRDLSKSMYERMTNVFPQLAGTEIEYAWGGYVAITANRAPHFGRIGKNILFAHGFSGHGIATTGLAGKLMADTIQGQAEKFDVFAKIPHMPFPGGRMFRTPSLVLAMMWFRLRDLLP
jgi:gamma-glutamylputrescine oxidase